MSALPLDPALSDLLERACAATGTAPEEVLEALTEGGSHEEIPAALLAGWNAADMAAPTQGDSA